MPRNISAKIVCSSQKVLDMDEKRLHWASVVRVSCHPSSLTQKLDTVLYELTDFIWEPVCVFTNLRWLSRSIQFSMSKLFQTILINIFHKETKKTLQIVMSVKFSTFFLSQSV